MCSVQYLREFIKQRLTAACEEIFSEVQKTVGHYEEEIDRQRRLLDMSRKPDTNSHITGLVEQHDCEEKGGLDEQQICNQERSSILDQEDPEPPQIQEKQEELCNSQEGEQLGVKQEADTFMVILTYEGSVHSEADPNCEQLLSYSSPEAENQDQEESQHVDSGSTKNAGLKKSSSHTQTEDTAPVSESQSQTDIRKKSLQCGTCGKTFQYKSNFTKHLSVHTELPQQHDCVEEGGQQQICSQERNSSLDLVDPQPPQIKEEQEELCSSQEGEQLGLKQEAEGIWTDEEQHRLLETMWKPEIKLHRIDLQQQHVCEEEDMLTDQQVCNQERNFCLDQEDPEPPQIKEEQEELCNSQEGEQLGLKQEADTFMATPTYEESDHMEAEPNSEQLFSHSSPEVGSQDEQESQHVDSGSTRNAELKKSRSHRKSSHTQTVDNAPVSETQSQTYTKKKSLQCDTCGKIFNYKSQMISHLRIHTGEKPYCCSTCGKRFGFLSALKLHMRIHTGEKPYPCDTCEKRFSLLSALKIHLRSHTGEKPYPCNTCGRRFSQSTNLQKHMTCHTMERPYSCSTCGKNFTRKSILKTHARIHTGEMRHSCYICGERFSRKSMLKSHLSIHRSEKLHSCSICGERFSQKSVLNTHIKIHREEKPHLCSICGKRFLQKSYLKIHVRIHAVEMQYPCSICEKRFLKKSYLKLHARIHTGERPYLCSICGKKFIQKGNMKKHMKIHIKSLGQL